jgi:hypothetical protein
MSANNNQLTNLYAIKGQFERLKINTYFYNTRNRNQYLFFSYNEVWFYISCNYETKEKNLGHLTASFKMEDEYCMEELSFSTKIKSFDFVEIINICNLLISDLKEYELFPFVQDELIKQMPDGMSIEEWFNSQKGITPSIDKCKEIYSSQCINTIKKLINVSIEII